MPKAQSTGDRKPPNKHQPTKAEMEEVIVIPAPLDQLAGAVRAGGAPRREPVIGEEPQTGVAK